MDNYYTYIYLDPRKPGKYVYGDYIFDAEPFYVGKGKGEQWKSHLDCILKENKIFGNKHKFYKIKKILKEGVEPIIIKIEKGLTETKAFEFEIWMIWAIGRSDLKLGPLTNHTDGGEGVSGNIVSEETREKLRQSLQGNKNAFGYKHSPEAILKISANSSGKNNGMYGKNHTDEVKNKISQIQTGRIKSEVERKDIAKRMHNRVVSEETREKSRISKLGNKNGLGYKQTEEHIRKRMDSRRRTMEKIK